MCVRRCVLHTHTPPHTECYLFVAWRKTPRACWNLLLCFACHPPLPRASGSPQALHTRGSAGRGVVVVLEGRTVCRCLIKRGGRGGHPPTHHSVWRLTILIPFIFGPRENRFVDLGCRCQHHTMHLHTCVLGAYDLCSANTKKYPTKHERIFVSTTMKGRRCSERDMSVRCLTFFAVDRERMRNLLAAKCRRDFFGDGCVDLKPWLCVTYYCSVCVSRTGGGEGAPFSTDARGCCSERGKRPRTKLCVGESVVKSILCTRTQVHTQHPPALGSSAEKRKVFTQAGFPCGANEIHTALPLPLSACFDRPRGLCLVSGGSSSSTGMRPESQVEA